MLYGGTSTDEALTESISRITRTTTWQLVNEMPLTFDAKHPQGMARIDGAWWVSTVDIEAHEGSILVVDDSGDLIDRVLIDDPVRYHPGGMDFDGSALWIASAEYRPDSTATIYRLEPGGTPERVFDVDDHVGAIARCGANGDLVGWSWGSRRFYCWSVDGELLAARINPSFFVDHQDCQWLETGHLLCGGVAAVNLPTGPGWLGGLGLLDVDDLVMRREAPFPIYPSSTGRVGTHNPLWAEVRGDQLLLHLLPDDGMGTLLTYATPLASRSVSNALEPSLSATTSS